MSGGHFNYEQHKIADISAIIEDLIYHNGSSGHTEYPSDVIEEFREAVRVLRKAHIYAHRIDWLVSGDDGIGSFKVRLAEDLKKEKT